MTQGDAGSGKTSLGPIGTVLLLASVLCAVLTYERGAEGQVIIPLSPEPVGSGARALGQSAFIAVADDATAASWNPAGLINLERPEASFVGIWRAIANDISGAGKEGEDWSVAEINFMSYALPVEVGNTDMVLSVNYHQVYDLGLEYRQVLRAPDAYPRLAEASSKGAISAYSLAGALSVPAHPEVTIGASFNWYTESLLEHHTLQLREETWVFDQDPPRLSRTKTETMDDFRAQNFTFGLLWDAYERKENLLTLGFVCHTPFAAEADYTAQVVNYTQAQDPYSSRVSIDFPLSLGMGANYRFSDRTNAAFDVQWTQWSRFNREHTGSTSRLDDTFAFRLGGERLFLGRANDTVFACRGGLFYEPRPAWGNILRVYGFSLGAGWTVKEKFSLDFAYQFRRGKGSFHTVDTGNSDFDYELEEHWLIASVIRYF